MDNKYDIIIVGGGPAGLTAGVYAARARMKTLLIEKSALGGQMNTAERIENYPGFPKGIPAPELAKKMAEQAKEFGLEVKTGEAVELINQKDKKIVKTHKEEYEALAVIVATGERQKKLDVPGERELTGRGVSYCATCDGPLFRNREVAVVGGGDAAIEEALFLTKFAKKVTVVHRRNRLRATRVLQERAFANKKIDFAWGSVVSEILGKDKVEGVRLEDVNTKEKRDLTCQGAFIFIGTEPNTKLLSGIADMTGTGHIITDSKLKTSVDGVYACGDARDKPLRQIVTACGEGATAAFTARLYVEGLKGTAYA